MAHIRKSLFLPGIALVLITATALPQAEAATGGLEHYQSLCKQNVLCSAEARNEGVVFKLHKPGRTEKLLCKTDGSCEVMMPRGRRLSVNNIEVRLTAN